jgi:hypothetical protein
MSSSTERRDRAVATNAEILRRDSQRMSATVGNDAELARATPSREELRRGRDEPRQRRLRLSLEALPESRFLFDQSQHERPSP